jgi:hypothetical protein
MRQGEVFHYPPPRANGKLRVIAQSSPNTNRSGHYNLSDHSDAKWFDTMAELLDPRQGQINAVSVCMQPQMSGGKADFEQTGGHPMVRVSPLPNALRGPAMSRGRG